MAAANPGTGARLRTWMKHRRQDARSPGDAVAFGRIDDRLDSPLYIGHEVITDEDRNILVISWKTRAAAPYYEASPDDPMGLVRRRTFTCDGNSIVDFTDVVFRQLVRDIAALDAPDPLLLSELDSARTGAMRDIVATIQAAQYELIRAPMDQVLVVEGGPGTGKTAVALHRVSWLLYNDGDRLGAADVLIVGPHPAFTRYVRTVLPDLGDIEVEHRDIGQLAPPVQRGRSEPPEVSRLKGDARMAGLLARAIEGRIGVPEAAERMLFDGRFVTLSGVDVATLVTACRHAGGPYATRRQLLRERLLDLARERGAPTDRARLDAVDDLVERLWPQFSTAAFLHGLLGSRARLTAAAGDEFTAGEVALLHRRGSDRLSSEVWSAADLALLDEVDDLIFGTDQRYRHIVVDEAQDLSPDQWRLLRAAVPPAADDLFIAGDTHQRIYQNRISLRDVGIKVTGRSTRLTVNYRTTAEILAWSLRMLRGERRDDRFDDMDGGLDTVAGYRCELHGRPPSLRRLADRNDELGALTDQVRRWLEAGIEPDEIGVATRSNWLSDAAVSTLRLAGVPVRLLTKDGSGVAVGTMHRMKGLEFRCMAVIGVSSEQMPPAGAITPAEEDRGTHLVDLQRERCLLFVACTRAREQLYVSWHGSPSTFIALAGS